jgi:transcriptional regulator with XRE-family HTH domain
MENLNIVGPQIRKLRSQRGWTQDYLAGALQRAGLDVSRSGVAKIEARMVWVPDHELFYFMKVFRVDFEDLFPSVDPYDPNLYETLVKLMKSRF